MAASSFPSLYISHFLAPSLSSTPRQTMADGAASLLSRLSMDTPTSPHAPTTTKQLPPHLAQSSSVSPPNQLATSPRSSGSSHGFGKNGSRRKSSFGTGHYSLGKSPDESWRVDSTSQRPVTIVPSIKGFVVPNLENGIKSPLLSSRSPPRQSAARNPTIKDASIGRGDTSTSRWATAAPVLPTTLPLPPIASRTVDEVRVMPHQVPSISATLESTQTSTIPAANPIAVPTKSTALEGRSVSRSPTKPTALGGRSRWDYEGIAEDKRIAELERIVVSLPVAPIPPPPPHPTYPTTALPAVVTPIPTPLPAPIPLLPPSPPAVISLPLILSPVASPSKSEFKIDWANDDDSDDELPPLDDEWMTEAARTRRASVSPVVTRTIPQVATPTAILRRPPPKSAPNLFPPRSAGPPQRNPGRSPTPAARMQPLPPPSSSASPPEKRSRSGRGRGRAPAPPAGAVFARLSGSPPAKAVEGEVRRGGRRGGPSKEHS